MPRTWPIVASFVFAASFAAGDARAVDGEISLSEVAPPPVSSGVDRATLVDAAQGEIRRIDASSRAAKGRRVLVSVALVRASDAPVTCTVNATLRDKKTGNMIAVLEGRARSDGAGAELKKQVAHAAVARAVRLIPDALAGN